MTTTIVQNSFLPTQISGCQLWFDAADRTTFTLNGSAVSSWRDKSANGYSVGQATGGNQPTYATNLLNGLPGIQLSISTYLYQLGSNMPNFASANAITVFIVAKNGTSLGGGWNIVNTMYFTGGAGATLRYHFSFGQNGTNGVTLYANNSFIGQTTVVPLNTNAIIGFTVASTGTNINVNSTLTNYTGASLVSANDSTWFIFGDARGTFVSDVNVYEFVGYSTTLTTAQRQQVEGYLAQKWGLQSSLPSNHPYKYSAYFTNQAYISTMVSQNLTNRLNNAAFLPTSIPGCQLWFDAADRTSMTFSGSTVTQWNDKSGNGRNATNGAYVAPTYSATAFNGGYPGLLFNGSSTMLNTAALLPTPVLSANGTDTTIFIVFNSSGVPPSGGYGLYGLGSQANTYTIRTPWAVGGAGGGAIIDTTGNSRIVASFASAQNPAQLYSVFRTGASHYFYQFGSLTASNLSSSGTVGTTSQTFGIGGGIADTTFFNSYISEIIIYNVALTTAQRQQVEGYLAWKWSLVSNLPPTHPYKKTSAVFATQPSVLAALNANPYNNMILFKYFNPTSIAGTQLWLDAADSTTVGMSGTRVISWSDKSVNAYTAVQSSLSLGSITKSTQNNLSVIATNSQVMTISSFSWTRFATMFFVLNTPSWFYVAGASSYNAYVYTPNWALYNTLNNGATFFDSVNAVGQQVLPTNQWCIFSIGYGGGTQATNYGINGTPRSTTTVTPIGDGTAVAPLWLNGRWDYTTGDNAIIAEILHYNTSLSTPQRQQVEGYLAWKWGLQANLPATHPFKGYPPPP